MSALLLYYIPMILLVVRDPLARNLLWNGGRVALRAAASTVSEVGKTAAAAGVAATVRGGCELERRLRRLKEC